MKQFATWHDRPMIMVALASGKRYAGNAAGMLQACGAYWASVRAAAQPLFHTSRSHPDSAHCNHPVSAACPEGQNHVIVIGLLVLARSAQAFNTVRRVSHLTLHGQVCFRRWPSIPEHLHRLEQKPMHNKDHWAPMPILLPRASTCMTESYMRPLQVG